MTSKVLASLCLGGVLLAAEVRLPRRWFLNAHNSYPEDGRGFDRLERARRAGLGAVDLDLAWSEARGRAVLSHDNKLAGDELTPEEYFFTPMLPELRRLPAGQPGLLLMIDLKSSHPGPVRELHALLKRHSKLLTRATRAGEVRFGPLTVILSENAAAIDLFEKLTPPGEPYLAMGIREPPERKFQPDIAAYLPAPATAFYRLFNFEWKHIEQDANPQAGAFTAAERQRLEALVKLARAKGYWTRAWTLNATTDAWGRGRNFGSRQAMTERWRAAWEAGVDIIATDEYEMAGEYLRDIQPDRSRQASETATQRLTNPKPLTAPRK